MTTNLYDKKSNTNDNNETNLFLIIKLSCKALFIN